MSKNISNKEIKMTEKELSDAKRDMCTQMANNILNLILSLSVLVGNSASLSINPNTFL